MFSSLVPAHRGLDGQSAPQPNLGVETAVHWVHASAALGWVAAVAVLIALSFPTVRQLLTEAARRWFDARLETIILTTGVLTAVLVLSGVYNLKRSTPYPTPYLSAAHDRVLDLPDAKPYFLVLAVKLVVYVLMLVAVGAIIKRARALAEPTPHAPRIGGEPAEDGSGAVAVAVRVEAPPAPAPPKRFVVAPSFFAAGAVAVLLCVSLLSSLHLKIEGLPAPPPDPLSAEHVAGELSPAFQQVTVTAASATAWDVTLLLADIHTKVPVSNVVVTVTGTEPDGVTRTAGQDFTNLGNGRYRGRISGPPGAWELAAVAVGGPGTDVPPTQQTFDVVFRPKTAKATAAP